jgi:beta-lysine 5,6-aminomutase beta subunit
MNRRNAHEAAAAGRTTAPGRVDQEPGPIVRPYGDTTGDGMVQVSFTLPLPHDKRAEGAALQLANKMGIDPALLVHAKAIGEDFTFFVVYGPVNHLVDISASTSSSATSSCCPPRRSTRRQEAPAPQVGGRRRPASAPTPTPSASTPSSTSRDSRGRRAWSTTARSVHNLGAQVARPRARQAPASSRPTPSSSRRSSPSGRAHPQHDGDEAAFREAFPAGKVPHADRRRPALRGGLRRRAGRRSHLRPRHHPRRGRLLSRPRPRRPGDPGRHHAPPRRRHEQLPSRQTPRWAPPSSTAGTCRTATPITPGTSSTAPIPWPPSATSPPRCASAPTATRGSSRPTPMSSSRPRSGRGLHRDRSATRARGHSQPGDDLRGPRDRSRHPRARRVRGRPARPTDRRHHGSRRGRRPAARLTGRRGAYR